MTKSFYDQICIASLENLTMTAIVLKVVVQILEIFGKI